MEEDELISDKEDVKVRAGSFDQSGLTPSAGCRRAEQETSNRRTTAEEAKAKSSRGPVADQEQGDG